MAISQFIEKFELSIENKSKKRNESSRLGREVALHRGMGHCGYRWPEKFQTLLAAVVV
jgi:hypothetical protein